MHLLTKLEQAAGVYKMASSLGGAFGVAISATVYGAIAANGNLETAATIGIIVNVIFGDTFNHLYRNVSTKQCWQNNPML